ncbi:ABC transporter substrate-binding protein [Arthrobacter castelli]|uniref:ABC transporter substrate-binding protein n=1 Tax=Arthrobacter castelli TaxID=271431 RepID=UPI00138AC9CB|nr:sugar ABC transporter substrate-binding protein [Arthrobacter castelli]
MVKLWNKNHPDIQVTLQKASWEDARAQFTREAQAQEGPDVLQVGFVWTSSLAEAGLLAPLDEYVKKNPPGQGIDDFIGTDLATVDDSLYALPWTVDTGTIVYRPDVFKEAGVKMDTTDWASFQKSVAQVSKQSQGDVSGYCFNAANAWFQWNAYIWSNGDTFVKMEDGKPVPGMTKQELAESIKYFNGFFDSGATPKSNAAVLEYGSPVLLGGLQRGDCAASFLPIAPYRSLLSENPDLKMRSAPMPAGEAGMASFLGGRALAVSAASEHPEAAYKFAKWMTNKKLFQELGYPWWPAQDSKIEAMKFSPAEQGYKEVLPNARTFAEYVKTGIPVDGVSENLNQELSGVFSDRATPEQAAENILRILEEAIADV